jgi:hypothetical protein
MADVATPIAQPLPAIGTRAVHKDNHKDSKGPVWEVTGHLPDNPKPVKLAHARGHKANAAITPDTRQVTPEEFKSDYVQM